MNIAQSVVLISAAGSSLGKTIALHFAALGARLALIDLEGSSLESTEKACKQAGAHCISYLLYSHDEEDIANVVDTIYQDFGDIDILINYWSGSDLPSLLSPASVDDFSRSLAQGATSFFIFGKHTANIMRQHEDKPSVIVNLAANQIDKASAISSSSKAIINSLTQSWAKELAEYNIRVGGVVPLALNHDSEVQKNASLSMPLQYEIVRSAEYIIQNDYFNGRMIEAEVM